MCRMLSSSSMVLCVGLCVLVVCFMGCPKPAQEGPQAAFSHTPGSGYDPLTVDFTDQSVAGSSAITAWSWSFGDGGSSTEQAPRHIYTVPGVYSVALTVTSGDGTDTETVSDCVTVHDATVDVLILHNEVADEAQSLADILETCSFTTRIYSTQSQDLSGLDLARAGVIMLCSDAHLNFTLTDLSRLSHSGKGIIGADRGYTFGAMGLDLEYGASGASKSIEVADAGHPVFNTPNPFGVIRGDELAVYRSGSEVSSYGPIYGSPDLHVLAYFPGVGPAASPLIYQDDIYLFWGWCGHFDELTLDGLKLLENCITWLWTSPE